MSHARVSRASQSQLSVQALPVPCARGRRRAYGPQRPSASWRRRRLPRRAPRLLSFLSIYLSASSAAAASPHVDQRLVRERATPPCTPIQVFWLPARPRAVDAYMRAVRAGAPEVRCASPRLRPSGGLPPLQLRVCACALPHDGRGTPRYLALSNSSCSVIFFAALCSRRGVLSACM